MPIIQEIRKELKKNVEQEYKIGSQNFFREKIKLYGVCAKITRQIAKKYFVIMGGERQDKNLIFKLIEELLKNGFNEEASIAFDWTKRLTNKIDKKDFVLLEKWLKKYIDNWAKCDDFCTHTIGFFLLKFPQFLPKLKMWAKDKNRWVRRASAVSLIYSLKRKKYLKECFKIANILLKDDDDMVQKGYGWMLKEASNVFQKEVFKYVMANKKEMPRTALRYAIEKMPANLKKEAIKR